MKVQKFISYCNSLDGINIRLWDGRPRYRGSIPDKGPEIYHFSKAPRTALQPTHHPIQKIQGAPSPGVKQTGPQAHQSDFKTD